MLRGLYTAASGMNHELNRQDAIANNLANINTSGYKKDEMIGASFHHELYYALDRRSIQPIGFAPLGVETDEVYTYLATGNILTTENPLDLAIVGAGYFVVDNGANQALTRNGHFTRNAQGYLATDNGELVLGENGPIRLDGPVEISADGIIRSNDQVIDRLLVVMPADEALLVKEGHSRFIFDGEWTRLETAVVQQGALENSNVNTIEEMTKMIAVTRAYESNQKVIAVADGVMNKIANEIGRL
ncbi:MAG: flagellar hook-basal body protein [Firmicutes bacterium]|nr:flagellar hook-basal body protein [Bacillota bacterium]